MACMPVGGWFCISGEWIDLIRVSELLAPTQTATEVTGVSEGLRQWSLNGGPCTHGRTQKL